MSDERLREMERRWQETGSVQDEAAYLKERVRAGELAWERLELAAYCGHAAACLATGSPASAMQAAWFEGLDRWGAETVLRACVAAARFVYPVWSKNMRGPQEGEWVTEALRAAEACLLAPSGEGERIAEQRASDAFGAAYESDLEGTVEEAAADACAHAARAAARRSMTEALEAFRSAVRAERETEVVEAIREEVSDWALGREDPLVRWRT